MRLGVPAVRIPTERCVHVYWLKNDEPRYVAHTWVERELAPCAFTAQNSARIFESCFHIE